MTWVKENEAAAMINRRPKTLRRLVKAAVIPITYTTINGRGFLYSKADIEKVLVQNSNKPK